jgi:FAD/FMN-containing dehydrogenase/Fe-S oxidoreductase
MPPASTSDATSSAVIRAALAALAERLDGELHADDLARAVYATDASEYQERPLAVALPKSEADVRELVRFAAAHRVGLIPRGAGTSLAGQVVGGGIVVDLGRHLDRIVALDVVRRRVRVQPGVVRNELNRVLAPHGLFFAPETSTANWATIGGMVGNNSCGANSIAYGSTRDHVVAARGFLADGSEVTFASLSPTAFAEKCAGPDTLERRIHRTLRDLLGDVANRTLIRDSFPRPEVTRRNTGYALDAVMQASCFDPGFAGDFNLCRLLAGSEGTLALAVEFELALEPLPPPGAMLVAHFRSVDEALRAAVVAMRHRPTACELIDDKILACTKANAEQARNRDFVVGEPGAVLVVELRHADRPVLESLLAALVADLQAAGLGYAFPVLFGAEGEKVWALRRAGQGLVNNLPGDAKAREVVEDTAVAVADLPAYVAEFDRLLAEKYGIDCVHYAHAGAGELHLRPLFDLHTRAGLKMFRDVATDVAALVKRYRGSLSGEHGDGRLRGEFVRSMVGDACYELLVRVKRAFDPDGILNPGKIVEAPPMDEGLRIEPGTPPPHETFFRFADSGGVLRAAEKCTGVGQCRTSHLAGGTMCPSYMATRDETHTTRARANVLRQALAGPPAEADPWSRPELAAVMDLCLSCKACRSECPSNVDMARLKAEWQQHWHDAHGAPLRTRLLAGVATLLRRAAAVPWAWNLLATAPGLSHLVKRALGIAAGRSLPTLPRTTLTAWLRSRVPPSPRGSNGRVHLFCDEFTDTLDATVGMRAVELLEALGYAVVVPPHDDSGRAQLSLGLVRDARTRAAANVTLLDGVVSDDAPLVGIEPSAILSFRDEYPDLVPGSLAAAARRLAARTFTIDEFLAREARAGRITADAFTAEPKRIALHPHCHQKALCDVADTAAILALPRNYTVEVIRAGCCGMAGAFGYGREHFDISMRIGELMLFPFVRAANAETLIVAPGTSCRHQIRDGTGRTALHPVEVLHAAIAASRMTP